MSGSAPTPCPYDAVPPDVVFVPRRITLPPAQRTPSPKTMPSPPLICASPWKKSADVVGGRLDAMSTSESFEMLATPVAPSAPPPVVNEFSQPRPAVPLVHGQAAPVPSPAQNTTPGVHAKRVSSFNASS